MRDSKCGNKALPKWNGPVRPMLIIEGLFHKKFTLNSTGNRRSRLHLPCYSRNQFVVPLWEGPQRRGLIRAFGKSSPTQRILMGEFEPLMTPSYTLTLFSEQPDLGPRPTSIAASVLLHTLAIAVAWFSVVYKPPFARISSEHYKVRELDLDDA